MVWEPLPLSLVSIESLKLSISFLTYPLSELLGIASWSHLYYQLSLVHYLFCPPKVPTLPPRATCHKRSRGLRRARVPVPAPVPTELVFLIPQQLSLGLIFRQVWTVATGHTLGGYVPIREFGEYKTNGRHDFVFELCQLI